ncbi:hypothetical protein [Cryobacterium arcticum]|uniref:Uncharacterized protein n=1 Tax=Cryobacterium arcticum TaxID=670052 RepID=A0A1B1BKI5_9MICO|nr:hypothetical protein [Cryobacterium arcticum]ANP73028.1 hypothetical protein PA27867_2076 [Cryobacterium arcticum]
MDSLKPQNRPTLSPWPTISTLVLAWLVIAVSFVSLLGLLMSSFYFDPDDYSGEYYLAMATKHQRDMLFALLLPAASLVLSGLSFFLAPRAGARVAPAIWAGGVSVVLVAAMIFVGVSNIHGDLYYAELFGY